jgi:hypothetical protein
MKKLFFLVACLVTVCSTAAAKTSTAEAGASFTGFVNGYGNSFIFVENGIEFSVFPDGQFDFYAQASGPNVNMSINQNNFSFNKGFNYNPFVQFDRFGAVVQIENTPIFYDFYGRVSQVGNLFIRYNRFGRVNRIGGLNLFWNGNVFSHHNGFINVFNRGYIYKPWHRFYALPAFNLCIVNKRPYRQFYNPVRHTFFRPYKNNARLVNLSSRRVNGNFGKRGNGNIYRRYAQTPRNERERTIDRQVLELKRPIARNRTLQLAAISTSARLGSTAATTGRTTRTINGRNGNVTQVAAKRNSSKSDHTVNRSQRNENAVSNKTVAQRSRLESNRVNRNSHTLAQTSTLAASRGTSQRKQQVSSRRTINTATRSASLNERASSTASSGDKKTRLSERHRQ